MSPLILHSAYMYGGVYPDNGAHLFLAKSDNVRYATLIAGTIAEDVCR